MANEVSLNLVQPGSIVYFSEPFPLVTIWAHRTTDILENEREMSLPLRVTRFDPVQSVAR